MKFRDCNAVLFLAITSVVIFLMAGCLSSCIPLKEKNQKKVAKIAVETPVVLADYCARIYPVIAHTDSSGYKMHQRIIDSLRDIAILDSLIAAEEIAELQEQLDLEKRVIKCDSQNQVINCDSLSEPLYRMVAAERRRADNLDAQNKKLIAAAKAVKPVIDTVVDRAALDRCEEERRNAIANEVSVRGERDAAQKKAKKRGAIMWSLIAAVALVAGYKLYSKYKSQLKL